jgi:hypothetical protein
MLRQFVPFPRSASLTSGASTSTMFAVTSQRTRAALPTPFLVHCYTAYYDDVALAFDRMTTEPRTRSRERDGRSHSVGAG